MGVVFGILACLVFYLPYNLGDPENFIKANPMVTPVHIMPERYFLFAYAILRVIPRKLGGVLGLVASIAVLYLFPLFRKFTKPTAYNAPYQIKRLHLLLQVGLELQLKLGDKNGGLG